MVGPGNMLRKLRGRRRSAAATDEQPRRTVRSSPRVFSYYTSNRRELDSSGARNESQLAGSSTEPRGLNKHKTVLIVCAVVALLCIFQLLRLSPSSSLLISEDAVMPRPTDYYQTALDTKLRSSLLNRTKLTFSATAFRDWLHSTFPEVEAAEVHIDLIGKRPRVELTFKRPAAILETSGQRIVIAQDGTALLQASDANSSALQDLFTVIDEANLPVELGSKTMSSADIRFIQEINRQLSGQGYAVGSFALTATGRDVLARLSDRPEVYIRFVLEEDAAGQAGRAVAVLNQLAAQGKVANEYLDVRVDERVYYR